MSDPGGGPGRILQGPLPQHAGDGFFPGGARGYEVPGQAGRLDRIVPGANAGDAGQPAFAFPVPELTALFAQGYEIIDDYVPDVSFDTRVGQERVRVLRRQG